ncbi:MAG: hypothetical protein P4L99_07885, partial [Chthoniobacter sp.]|nr:hypothetical protein [Chthoniobacter sp.]
KIWNNGEKIGWIEGNHVRDMGDRRLGYFENNFVYNMEGRKVAYILENELRYENDTPAAELERVNEEIEGSFPILTKCAVKVLLDL